MLPQKILKIECLRLVENAPVASLTPIKGKDQQGEEEKGVINEGNRLIIYLFLVHVRSLFFDISKLSNVFFFFIYHL